eukprot:CAMPEP_0185777860 /NCGR_PEP_ID=MMETSP1174-20130828/90992_1 /TAXON_ID=35687 /ORGANISM="Dictyocha speculum, Strain CCMP1381" /LENGTH=65 /DNA_ID=CAMNT_0028466399 /DNA_START=42 /DNA_END=239 /DNA_ORIENTATION=-
MSSESYTVGNEDQEACDVTVLTGVANVAREHSYFHERGDRSALQVTYWGEEEVGPDAAKDIAKKL